MTWKPEKGLWSQQDFDGTGSHLPGDPAKQNVQNGYVTLLPEIERSASYVKNWINVSGWHFDHGLHSRRGISEHFHISGGAHYPDTASGSQQPISSAGAWQIETPPIQGTPEAYSGQSYEYISIDQNSSTTTWFDNFSPTVNPITFELDLACLADPYSGNPLAGFKTGQHSLSGIPVLTGILGHGIYVSDGTSWDYLEVTRFGIRSRNHPELALPIDLNTPKRIRVGIRDDDIFIQSEDGKGVAGLSQFDSAKFDNDVIGARVALGAPPTGEFWSFSGSETVPAPSRDPVVGFVGKTLWDNIKILTGEMRLSVPSGLRQQYPQGNQTFITDEFDPILPLSKWVFADVGFLAYSGGSTSVTPQYSGMTGWVDLTSATTDIAGTSSPITISLDKLPIDNLDLAHYPTGTVLGEYYRPGNQIRFKIEQQSSGFLPSPAIDYIKVVADSDQAFLDLVPNWKPHTSPVVVQVGIKSGEFASADPLANQYTVFLWNTPGTGEGIATGNLLDSSVSPKTGSVVGTGTFVPGGPFGNSFQSYSTLSGQALSGSEAHGIWGNQFQHNLFPNPLLDEGYEPVSSSPFHVTGKSEGEIADYLQLSPRFTGQAHINFSKKKVYRPENQARIANKAKYLGHKGTKDEFVQSVKVSNWHTGENGTFLWSAGIEAIVPTGILSIGERIIFSCDLQVVNGTGIDVYSSGSVNEYSGFLAADSFSQYRPFSIETLANDTGRAVFGFAAPTGENVEFNIDNIFIAPYHQGYLNFPEVTGQTYDLGVKTAQYLPTTKMAKRASTSVHGHIFLESYPSGENILFRKWTEFGSGIDLSITESGFLKASFDTESQAWGGEPDETPFLQIEPSFTMTGQKAVPLGKWTSFGFIHQCYVYKPLGYMAYTGQMEVHNFAACNRALLTMDGYPVESMDLMRHWSGKFQAGTTEVGPWSSYIPDATGEMILGSGLFCKLDAVEYSRPPVGDAENLHSIRGHRASAPYFKPDSMLKAGYTLGTGNAIQFSDTDLAYGSIWPLAGPGYTNWDHGSHHNHLLFYGSVSKDNEGPIPNLGCTVFSGDGRAIAPYCSAFDRTYNITGLKGVPHSGVTLGRTLGDLTVLSAGMWVNPQTTGIFFEMVEDDTDIEEGDALVIGLTGADQDAAYFFVGKKTATDTYLWETTSTGTYSTGAWHHVFLSSLMGISAGAEAALPYLFVSGEQVHTDVTHTAGAGTHPEYFGTSGDSSSSSIVLGRVGEHKMFDCFVQLPITLGNLGLSDGVIWSHLANIASVANTGSNKQGDFNVMYKNLEYLSGTNTGNRVDYLNWHNAELSLKNSPEPSNYPVWVGTNNFLNSEATANDGFSLYDRGLFREVPGYYVRYDDTDLIAAFGDTISPIRIGHAVPEAGINLARIDSPEFTVSSSINTIDLADHNTHNLSTYREGQYTITRGDLPITGSFASGAFRNINSGDYTGRADITFSGSVTTRNIDLTSVSVVDPSLNYPAEAYYAYLIGRGDWGVKIPDAFPHDTGTFTEYTTGVVTDNYIANIDRVKSNIHVKNGAGKELTQEEFPWHIITSPFTPDDLERAVYSGLSMSPQGIGLSGVGDSSTSGYYDALLPNGVFSVIMLTNQNTLGPESSVWVHFPGFNFKSQEVDLARSEVLNPMIIMRENKDFETAQAGRFNLQLNETDHETYNLQVYGVHSGYSGSF